MHIIYVSINQYLYKYTYTLSSQKLTPSLFPFTYVIVQFFSQSCRYKQESALL